MYRANILIADTNASVQLSLTHLLEFSGYGVQAVRPGRDVLACLANGRFQLLLLEIDLPAYNGLLLLDAIRRAAPALPIIILTSCHDSHTAVSACQFAISSYLVKPINPAKLLQQIEQALAGSILRFP